jgi:hypothetical protein
MPISTDIKQLIEESYFISEDTISVDLDKFESGECNKLIISGLMGSGKTTLGKQLAEKYKCPVIDTDDIVNEFLENKKNDNITRKDRFTIYNNEILKLLDNSQRQIISGINIAAMYGINTIGQEPDPEFKILLKVSYIFLGKSVFKSGIAATKRSMSISKGLNKLLAAFITPIIFIPGNIISNPLMNKLKKDRCSIKGAVIKPFKI